MLGWMAEISKQQRYGRANWQGKIMLPQMQSWSREKGGPWHPGKVAWFCPC